MLYKNVDIEFVSGRKATMTVYKGNEDGEVVDTIILSDYETEEEMHGIFERLGFEKLTQEEMDEKIRSKEMKEMNTVRDIQRKAEEKRRMIEEMNLQAEEMTKITYETEKKRYEKIRKDISSRPGRNNAEELQRLDERFGRVLADLKKKEEAAEEQARRGREL